MCNKKLLLKKLMEYPEINNNEYMELIKIKNRTNDYNEIKLIEQKINLYNEKQILINMIKLSNIPFESY
jgi:hypothetical protein